jgi:hypothetical protein
MDLPRIADPRGSLTYIYQSEHVPFRISRVFYIYDVPTEESRGFQAHPELQELIICLSGSIDVALDDGAEKRIVHLNRPWKGLYVPPLIWAAETNFDQGSICLVLASDPYVASDYIRDYDEFLQLAGITQA